MTTDKDNQQKIEKINTIYSLFLSRLNKLQISKNLILQNIYKRISNKKTENILKELKDKY